MLLPLVFLTVVVSSVLAGQSLGGYKQCVTQLGHNCNIQCAQSSGFDSGPIKGCAESTATSVYSKYIQCWKDHGKPVNDNTPCWKAELGPRDQPNGLASLTPLTAYVECMKNCGRPKLEDCNNRCTASSPDNGINKACSDQLESDARQGVVNCLGKMG